MIRGHETVSWTETFGGFDCAPEQVYGTFKDAAAVAGVATHEVSPEALEHAHREWLATVSKRSPEEILTQGSGWGFAEFALRKLPAWTHLPFPNVADDSVAFLDVLSVGSGVEFADEALVPPVSPRWREALDAAPDNWWSWLMRGIQAQAQEERERAANCYRASVSA